MRVQCDGCLSAFRVDESMIPADGAWVKCSKCGKCTFVKPVPKPVKPVRAAKPKTEKPAQPDRPPRMSYRERSIKRTTESDLKLAESRQWRPYNVGLAGFLAVLVPGLGHVYLSRFYAAVCHFLSVAVFGSISALLVLASIVVVHSAGMALAFLVLAGIAYLHNIASAVMIAQRVNRAIRATSRKCPFCAEQIRISAVVCPHCQRGLLAAPEAVTGGAPVMLGVVNG